MAAVQDDIEQQKQKKLRDIRKLLKEERKKRKKELFKYANYNFKISDSLGARSIDAKNKNKTNNFNFF